MENVEKSVIFHILNILKIKICGNFLKDKLRKMKLLFNFPQILHDKYNKNI